MNLHELCKEADYVGKNGILFNEDCLELMKNMLNEKEITLTLTDIPYDSVLKEGLMEYQFNNKIIKKMWSDRYQKNNETVEENLHRVSNYCGKNETEKESLKKFINDDELMMMLEKLHEAGIE